MVSIFSSLLAFCMCSFFIVYVLLKIGIQVNIPFLKFDFFFVVELL